MVEVEVRHALFDCGFSLGSAIEIRRLGKMPIRRAVRCRVGHGDEASNEKRLRQIVRRKLKRYSRG